MVQSNRLGMARFAQHFRAIWQQLDPTGCEQAGECEFQHSNQFDSDCMTGVSKPTVPSCTSLGHSIGMRRPVIVATVERVLAPMSWVELRILSQTGSGSDPVEASSSLIRSLSQTLMMDCRVTPIRSA